MQEDPIFGGNRIDLEEKKPLDFYQTGLKLLDITEDQLVQIGSLIHKLSNIKLSGLRPSKYPEKGVSNDHHRHLQGAVFAFGSEGYNKEWREHTASSIREMLSIFSSDDEDFNKTINELGKDQEPALEELKKVEYACRKIKKYYQFFTGVTHHQPDAITNCFRQLEDHNAENEICLSAESFKIVSSHFFIDMKKIIENIPNI